MHHTWSGVPTYIQVGFVAAAVIVLVGVIWPLTYIYILWAKNFIKDITPEAGEGPCAKAKQHLWPLDDEDLGNQFGCSLFIAALAPLIWPIMVAYALHYAILHFLRLASRLQRHCNDKGVHVSDEEE